MQETREEGSIRVTGEIKTFYIAENPVIDMIVKTAGEKINAFTTLDDFVSRLIMNVVQEFAVRMKRDEKEFRKFETDELKKLPQWQVLLKPLYQLMMKELKEARVVRKQKKVDVSEVKDTVLGAKILKTLEFGRRSMLKQTEYQELLAALRKANYEVPVVVEPTKTEQFFMEEAHGPGE